MKKLSKLFSVLLALTLALALAAPAFAASSSEEDTPTETEEEVKSSANQTGSITVENADTTATYTAYKIFDVTYKGEAYSYSISKDSAWLTVVQAYIAQEGDEGITLTKSADGNNYVVTTTAAFSAPDFAEYLYSNIPTTETGKQLTANDDEAVKASGLSLGYYFITSSVGSLANLTTTDPDVVIYDKNETPKVDKKQKIEESGDYTDDILSTEIGKTVSYQITGEVPSTTGYSTYTYVISDTLSAGLTLDANNISVKIGGTQVTSGVTVDTSPTAEEGETAPSFTVTFDMKSLQEYVGETITVTYTATVNGNAVAGVYENKAEVKYSNNPNDTTSTEKFSDETYVYDAEIAIDKYETGAETTKLSGATFVLAKKTVEGENTTYEYYKYTAATNTSQAEVEWVSNINDATSSTTDDKGVASFVGLEDGTYYLIETEAPEGYNLLTNEVEVTIDGTKIISSESNYSGRIKSGDETINLTDEYVNSQLICTTPVENSKGAELPSTGGIGTTIFYVIGGLLVIGAGIALITKKRMSQKG